MADLRAAAVQAAQQAGIDPDWYTSLIQNGEGGFDKPTAVSSAGARGPAQLMPATAAALGVRNIDDPVENLQGGARYARQMMDRFGDQTLATAAYNAGPEAVAHHGGVPPYPETQAYVGRVMGGGAGSSSGDPTMSADQVMKAYGWSGSGSGPPVPSGSPYPDTLPDGAQINLAGQRGVNFTNGAYTDAQGNTYQPASDQGEGYFRNQGGDLFHIVPGSSAPPAPTASQPTALPSPDEISKAYGWSTPAPAPTPKPTAAPNWFAAQNASRNAQYAAETAQARAAPLISPEDASRSIWNEGYAGLKSDLAAMTSTRPNNAPLDNILHPERNPVLDAFGRVVQMGSAPVAGYLDSLVTSPVSKVTGLPKPFVNQSLLAAGPEVAGAKPSYLGILARAPLKAASSVTAPFAAAVSRGAAASQAGARLAGAATDLPAVRANLANGPEITVPGSVPTTFQQTGDMGLGALERGVAARNPAAFQQRAAAQNAARVGALQGIQTGADPMTLQGHVRGALDALDAATQAHIDQLTANAQAKGGLLGGMGAPDEYGAATRDAVNQAETAARSRESGLWQAVDPNGDLTGNTVATSTAAKDIASSLPFTAKPMAGEEAGIFDAAQKLPSVSPVSDLIALRSRLSTAMREELISQGRSPAYARMAQLRGAIQDNLADSISQAVQADDARVAAGEVPPDQSVRAGLDAYFGDTPGLQAGNRSQVAAGARGPRGGSPGLLGGHGTEGSSAGGLVGAPRAPGLSPDVGLARSQIAQANAGQTGGLWRAMQELGGIRLRNPDGSLVPGPDVSPVLEENRVPGVINNASGLAPEAMAQALHERGFFGPNVTDPGSAFEEAVSRHAGGRPVYAEGAYEPGTAQAIAATQREQSEAGVLASDHPVVAARKVASYRQARDGLLQKAEAYGVPYEGRDLNDVWGDVAEREAIQGEGGGAVDPYGAEFDRLSGPRPTIPTFDQAAGQRLAAATAVTKQRAATFGQPPISSVTARAGSATQFRLPDGRVAGRFFHPGPTGYGDMQALLRASPESAPVIQDYAASTLRRAAMNEDGTLDPAKFARWQAQHANAIRALPPEQQGRFADAASASQAVADAAVNRAAQLKAGQAGAVGKLIGAQSPEEVVGRVGNILASPTRVSDMDLLARATADNPDARAGLRQAIADHITSRFIGNTEAGTSGVGMMRADPFQTFIRTARPALAKVFSPAELDSMNAIAADLARSKRSQTALKLPGGSNTAQDLHASGATGHGFGGIATVAATEGAFGLLGYLLGHWEGFGLMESAGAIAAPMIHALRAQGVARVDQLVSEAMLNPSVAKALLQRVPAKGGLTPSSMQGRVLLRALAGGSAVTGPIPGNPPRMVGTSPQPSGAVPVFNPPRSRAQ
jgi:hypothetical protein